MGALPLYEIEAGPFFVPLAEVFLLIRCVGYQDRTESTSRDGWSDKAHCSAHRRGYRPTPHTRPCPMASAFLSGTARINARAKNGAAWADCLDIFRQMHAWNSSSAAL